MRVRSTRLVVEAAREPSCLLRAGPSGAQCSPGKCAARAPGFTPIAAPPAQRDPGGRRAPGCRRAGDGLRTSGAPMVARAAHKCYDVVQDTYAHLPDLAYLAFLAYLISHPGSPHLTLPLFTSPYLTLPHLTSPDFTLPHLTSHYLTLPHLTSPLLTSY